MPSPRKALLKIKNMFIFSPAGTPSTSSDPGDNIPVQLQENETGIDWVRSCLYHEQTELPCSECPSLSPSQHSHGDSPIRPLTSSSSNMSLYPSLIVDENVPYPDPFAKGTVQIVDRYCDASPISPTAFFRMKKPQSHNDLITSGPPAPAALPSDSPTPCIGNVDSIQLPEGFRAKHLPSLPKIDTTPKPGQNLHSMYRRNPSPFPLLVPKPEAQQPVTNVWPRIRGLADYAAIFPKENALILDEHWNGNGDVEEGMEFAAQSRFSS